MSLYSSENIVVDREADGSYSLRIDVPGRGVNVITRQLLADLDGALDVLTRQERLPVVVIRSGKKTGFLAGADLHEFARIRDLPAALALSETGQRLFSRLSSLAAPTIAVIHGPCLGGGLELALACDYRLVYDRPDTQLGFPEVELGLLPGWGGTQRLPRAVGLERALQMILAGRRLGARDAFAWGLADAWAASESDLRDQFTKLVLRAIAEGKRSRARLPLRGWRQRLLESTGMGRRVVLRGTEKLLRNRVPDDMPAPAEALESVRVGLERGIDAGLAREREAAGRLALSPSCRNLINLFFQREAARKIPEGAARVQRVGVVGAGVMGAGVAQLAALAGFEVVVQEVSPEALAAGLARIDALFAKAVARRKLSATEAVTKRAAIRGTVTWEGFDRAEVVVEAAHEDLDVKRGLFAEMARRTSPTTILATNTSSIAVAGLQPGLPNPERLAGMHFFNPVYKMPLVEVAQAPGTSPEVVATLVRFAIDLGKTPIRVGDGPGFVVNRVLMPYLDEAVRLVAEGMSIREIDTLMKRFGMPTGPLALLDQLGLDVAEHVSRLMAQQLGRTDEPHPVFAAMKQQGWLGEKSGRGFYTHEKRKARVHSAAEALVRQVMPTAGDSLPEAARVADARERLVLLMVNEAARLLDEGRASDGDGLDLAVVFGTGWAPHRGGPLRYADDRGLTDIVRSLDALAARLGPRFAPCEGLRRRAANGERFRAAI